MGEDHFVSTQIERAVMSAGTPKSNSNYEVDQVANGLYVVKNAYANDVDFFAPSDLFSDDEKQDNKASAKPAAVATESR